MFYAFYFWKAYFWS